MRTLRSSLFLAFIAALVPPAALGGGFGEAFSRWLLGAEAEAAVFLQERPVLDAVADGCMQCHNGARVGHIAVKQADTPLQFAGAGLQANHPVGMDYDAYASRRPRDSIPRPGLDPAIIPVDGQVSCISCHRLKAVDRAQAAADALMDSVQAGLARIEDCTASNELTVGPGETDLCLGCHTM